MSDALFIAGLVALLLLMALIYFMTRKKKPAAPGTFPVAWRKILEDLVPFYQTLDSARRKEFEERIMVFLSQVRITGVRTEVEDLDRVLIGASAIIPIFQFPGWQYINLHEVLLYPDSFDHDFAQEGRQRSILGMVGSGPLNHVMILSRHELRQAFINKTGKSNAAIHEFVHLVDKTDGSIDGVPRFILEKQYVVPWIQLMHSEIRQIMENRSDIDPYGASNEAEFFAVVSEYFFERPDLLQNKHPELYGLLQKIFALPAGKKKTG